AWIDPLSASVLAACVLAVPVIDSVWLRRWRPRAGGGVAGVGACRGGGANGRANRLRNDKERGSNEPDIHSATTHHDRAAG
ncbi:hypothetical protein C6P74_01335, partial [Burkholderia multivorans]